LNLEIDNILRLSFQKLEIKFSADQLEQVKKYLNLLYKYNKMINLVGTKDKEGILIRHFLDCLSILKYEGYFFYGTDFVEKILDAGTGSGLPGILLSIFLEDKLFYLLDKTQKKIDFLKLMVKELGLKNVTVVKGRAEELSKINSYRETFDIVLARAVAKFNILSEFVIPFCRINGRIIFYKGRNIFNELEESRGAVLKLGGKVDSLLEIEVPYLNEFRAFLIIKKTEKSPEQYPRKFQIIKKKPL